MRAGIHRVVVAQQDPFAEVAGGGWFRKGEGDVGRASHRLAGEEVEGFDGDVVWVVDGAGGRGDGAADVCEGVADYVVEGGFVELT